jgi:MoaA/NifB/PqqE/SkfB family radical SAM enzyme
MERIEERVYVDFVPHSCLHATVAWKITYSFNFLCDFCVRLVSFYRDKILKFLDSIMCSVSSSYCTNVC